MNTDNQSLRRMTENEAVFRRHNEQTKRGLERLGQAAEKGTYHGIISDVEEVVLQFCCECADEQCLQRLSLTMQDYGRIHANRSWFVVAPDHQAATVERVVEKHPDYYVVEKFLDPPENPTTLHKTDIDNT